MYEDDVPVFRRILWIALWFVVVVAVLWVLVWLIFFRHSTPKVSTSHKSGNQHSSQSNQPPKAASSGGSSSSTGSGNTETNGSSSTTAQPDELANTGAGDVLVPFVVAGMTGSVLYYVRLRKKLLA